MRERDIFDAALAIADDADRSAYLDLACAGDPALRRHLDGLLEVGGELGDFLEFPAIKLLTTKDESASGSPDTTIGAYRLLEQIGEGGFGLVFLADQQQPVRRRVAVKVLKPGMDTKQVIARFEAERQALALMDHPNIARVLDGGESSSGRPFFVMDLVRGLSITEYCDQNQLPPRQRLELFLSVCHAVQHAHQKGIIHRDLKPSNILVTEHEGAPVVKIIDFGIAKTLGQPLTDKTLYTGVAQMIGTPAYMSPEQVAPGGLDVDTRSDIYSLGVLLYELLTGTTPFEKDRLQQVGFDEMRRIIREEEPPKPSTRITTMAQVATTVSARRQSDPRRLRQVLRGELDWIVMKALEKDRDRRYESASAFAADVQRYLADEPVQACPPSAWYRGRKFARRCRGRLVMASVIMAAVFLAAGSFAWMTHEYAVREAVLNEEVSGSIDRAGALLEEEKWPEAQAEIEQAEKLLTSAGRADQPPRLLELRRDLSMAERLQEIYNRPKSPDISVGQQHDLAYAEAFRNFGIDLAVLSEVAAAEQIRSRSIRLVLVQTLDFWSILRRWGNEHDPGPPVWWQILKVANAADPDPWRTKVREALISVDARALGDLVATADVRQLPPQSVVLLGRILVQFTEEPQLADRPIRWEQVADVLRQAQRQYPADLWINFTLAEWLSARHQHNEAMRYYAAALAVRPQSPYLWRAFGCDLCCKGAYAEAVAYHSKAIGLKPDYAYAWFGRGECYSKLNQPDLALSDFARAFELDPIEPERAPSMVFARGLAYEQLHLWDKALADFTRVIDWYGRMAPGMDSPARRETRAHRAFIHAIREDWRKAADDLTPDQIQQVPPWDNNWFQLACLLLLQGDDHGYQELCRQLLECIGQTKEGFAGHQAFMASRASMLRPETAADRAQGVIWAKKALAGQAKVPWYLHALALARYRAGESKDAIARCNDSMNADPGWAGNPLNWLLIAAAHKSLGESREASDWLDKANKWRKAAASSDRQPGVASNPDLSDWLEFQVLWREAETVFGKDALSSTTQK